MAYIVKNCPCYQEAMYTFDAATGEKKLTEKHVCISPNHGGYCLKCSDCVIKKVIEDCTKQHINHYMLDLLGHEERFKRYGREELGIEIKNYFDIEDKE